MPYTVTRQHQWPEGGFVVEISLGGYDYCNPGALVNKYAGEGETYPDPREAVEAAVRIAQAWQEDRPEDEILIGMGGTGGMTMPFDGEPLTEETFARLRKHAQEVYDELPKCDRCVEVLDPNKTYTLQEYDVSFCSENCAENWVYEWEKELAEADQDEE